MKIPSMARLTPSFSGVPLKAILEKYNITVDPQVKYVTAEGHDLPLGLGKPDFEHSIPVAPVLETGIQPAKFEVPYSPYASYQWTTQATLKPGTYEIWTRATDALGGSQPLDGTIFWNPNGYEWTGVFKCEVTVR